MARWIKKLKWVMKLIFIRPKHHNGETGDCPRCILWKERRELWGEE